MRVFRNWNTSAAQSETRGKSSSAWKRACLRARDEEGQALLEFAYVVPVLLTLVMGIVVFGSALNNYLVLTDATAVGARILSISRGQTTDPCSTASAAVIAAAPNLTSSKLTFAYTFNGVAFSGTTCNSASTTTGAAGDLVQGQSESVTVTYPCTLAVYANNWAPTCTLQSKLTEQVQ